MQPTRRALLATGGALGLAPMAMARARGPARAVVELFTSQGCSSCPPADRLMADLVRDEGLVVLSLPVDYWDRLGWKDTLAQHAFTQRQRAYARVRGDGEVYTPQAVVNGRAIAVGSDRGGILALAGGGLAVTVTLSREPDGLVATVEGAPPEAMLVATPFLRSREVAIGRGENADARVTYTNIVRELTVLGTVGAGRRFVVGRFPVDAAAGVAVLVQRGGPDTPGEVLGAGAL